MYGLTCYTFEKSCKWGKSLYVTGKKAKQYIVIMWCNVNTLRGLGFPGKTFAFISSIARAASDVFEYVMYTTPVTN